jgi:tetratricopeptide (TPR) repeat protein
MFILFYLSCGLIAGLTLLAIRIDAVAYGASLAVEGLLGGLIGIYGLRLAKLSKRARVKFAVLVLLAIFSVWKDVTNLQTGNAGHVAGLITGLALGVLLTRRFATSRMTRTWIFIGIAFVLLVAGREIQEHERGVVHAYAAARAFDSGKDAEAISEIRTALQINPDSISINEIASGVLLNAGDYSSAETAIRKVLAHRRGDEYFLYLLGTVELRTGRCAQARALSLQLAKIKSKYAPELSNSACYSFRTEAPDQR